MTVIKSSVLTPQSAIRLLQCLHYEGITWWKNNAAVLFYTAQLYLFELLLSPAVKALCVQSIRSFFRQQFATALLQLGNGLEHLAIGTQSLPYQTPYYQVT